MTVAELIEKLQKFDPTLDIYCKSNEGRDVDLLKANPFQVDLIYGKDGPELVAVLDLG